MLQVLPKIRKEQAFQNNGEWVDKKKIICYNIGVENIYSYFVFVGNS